MFGDKLVYPFMMYEYPWVYNTKIHVAIFFYQFCMSFPCFLMLLVDRILNTIVIWLQCLSGLTVSFFFLISIFSVISLCCRLVGEGSDKAAG